MPSRSGRTNHGYWGRNVSEPSRTSVTRLLDAVGTGDAEARDELWKMLNKELRAIAAKLLKGERPDHTLQATALVNEAWMRWGPQRKVDYRDRGHFMAICAELMRRILVDHARAREALKRGGGWERIALDDVLRSLEERHIDVLALEGPLEKLKALSERQATVVGLRYLGGLSIKQVAAALGVSHTTIEADSKMAKWFLARELRGDNDEEPTASD